MIGEVYSLLEHGLGTLVLVLEYEEVFLDNEVFFFPFSFFLLYSMVATELLSVTCLLWETCLPMQFNKHFLSVYGTQVIWGRGGVGGRMKGVTRNTKRNRVPELVSFKTDGEWHILRQLTVEPE